MYIPKHFHIDDQQEIRSFIAANAFAQLITQFEGRLFATHLPVLLGQDESTLLAHIARANPQHKNIDEQEVMLTFAGPHDYVSPSWYGEAGVPTWNYQAVHVYGRCKTFDQPERLKMVVDTLTEKYEAAYEQPWKIDYPASMYRGIVGLEITIDEVQAKYKLSQNRSEEDRRSVMTNLNKSGNESLALAMEANEKRRLKP